MIKRIFITGASGCIGQYIAETLIANTQHELYLLVRNPDKLKIQLDVRPGIHVLSADLRSIDRFADILKTIDCAILTAAAWGGYQDCIDINVTTTHQIMDLLDPQICDRVIYFSTASLLDRDNKILPEAGDLGTDYIRSKYDFIQQLPSHSLSDRTTVLFPTLVLGGDETKPLSHLTSGLPEVLNWIDWIRFFKADGSFHFIHARDIAEVVRFYVENESCQPGHFVLGNQPYTVDRAIREICNYLNKKVYFRISLSPWLINFFIAAFKIKMAAWDRFCLQYRHFIYQHPVNPATFDLPSYCETLSDVLTVSGIPPSSQNKVKRNH
ncbi:MAG: NAD(P)-dependent oxidoreductase [Geitlerinemataceae cyanobacterium]